MIYTLRVQESKEYEENMNKNKWRNKYAYLFVNESNKPSAACKNQNKNTKNRTKIEQ